MGSPKETSLKGNLEKKDKTLFLRFLHYLDSENLTADKNVQPGADPDYYLEELKKTRCVMQMCRTYATGGQKEEAGKIYVCS